MKDYLNCCQKAPKSIRSADQDGDREREDTAPEKQPIKEISTVDVGDDGYQKRETWSRKIDFLLACIGFSVGLGNVWRFPYLCYKNGGGAFLIPYLICVLVGGVPLFFLEVAVGQFMSKGGVGTWSICPLFEGIGWSCAIIVFFLNCYYNVILAWAFYYLFASFTSVLPWSHCNNPWNTEHCTLAFNVSKSNLTTDAANKTAGVDPVTEFWERKVLGISSGIDDIGNVKWDLALCLLLAWIVVYFCIWKGIKGSGKVMYFTAPSPYIFMLVLLIRGVTLPGAYNGIIYYLKPEWSKLASIEVWVDAGTQIFFSYSIGLGTVTALGSYNKFNHNSYRDAVIFSLANSGTSLFAGFVIFSILGYMAHVHQVDIKDVAAGGPGLAFIAYPKAVAELPISTFWSICFFIMIILLGLDSQFVGVEGFVTAIVDAYPTQLRKGYRREICIGIICFISFLIGLSMVTNGGMYVFQLFDYYSGSRIILLVGFFECIAIGWVYGVKRFYKNLEVMLGFKINYFMMISWIGSSPLFCLVIFILSAINYSELTYERPDGVYTYPRWSVLTGWAMASIAAIFIPLIMIYKVAKTIKENKPLVSLIQPHGLKPHQMLEGDYYQGQMMDVKKVQMDENACIPASPRKQPSENFGYDLNQI
ncbi:sodium- and chloride-dependent taurine transporter-like [Tubulanus polymorphus]|uniref:sodium- and chloride-dependent taurine transporter-like n=1 Tax=Tubulanus polymorphus TaxID=672921 RepID=UPI003DA69094